MGGVSKIKFLDVHFPGKESQDAGGVLQHELPEIRGNLIWKRRVQLQLRTPLRFPLGARMAVVYTNSLNKNPGDQF